MNQWSLDHMCSVFSLMMYSATWSWSSACIYTERNLFVAYNHRYIIYVLLCDHIYEFSVVKILRHSSACIILVVRFSQSLIFRCLLCLYFTIPPFSWGQPNRYTLGKWCLGWIHLPAALLSVVWEMLQNCRCTLNCCHAKFHSGNKNIFQFSIMPQNCDGAGSWSPHFRKTKNYFVLHSQYHGWWWSAEAKNQSISTDVTNFIFS